MKSEVLKELPEKIINDYYCEMTAIQMELYSEFENENHSLRKGKDEENILSSLSKMRKILNHPNLIGKHCSYEASGKFIALNELFEQLGFK
jgi:TATA-binding protein-associated factor